MGKINDSLKKIPGLQRVHRWLRWQVHIARDLKSYLWPATVSGIIRPFGFRLIGPDTPANRAMIRGHFDLDERAILERAMGYVDVFVDVGANIGLYTCIARSKDLIVVGIEPQPRNLGYMISNLVRNEWSDVEVWPVGLAESPGLATLYGASGPSASLLKGWAGYSTRFRQSIPVTTLDALIGSKFDGKRVLIKIDVEGAEYQVLKGATATLCRQPRPMWLIEICLSEFHPDGINPDFAQTFDIFWKFGYSAWEVRDPSRRVDPKAVEGWIHDGQTEAKVVNFLFCDSNSSQLPFSYFEEHG